MKKILLTLTAALLMSVSLVGCGGSGESSEEPVPNEVTSVQKDNKDVSKENDNKDEDAEKTAADDAQTEDSDKAESDS